MVVEQPAVEEIVASPGAHGLSVPPEDDQA
jgi:hypothetical protein